MLDAIAVMIAIPRTGTQGDVITDIDTAISTVLGTDAVRASIGMTMRGVAIGIDIDAIIETMRRRTRTGGDIIGRGKAMRRPEGDTANRVGMTIERVQATRAGAMSTHAHIVVTTMRTTEMADGIPSARIGIASFRTNDASTASQIHATNEAPTLRAGAQSPHAATAGDDVT